MKNRAATAFGSRIIIGCIISILVGKEIDAYFNSAPWVMVLMLAYTIVGSFYLLLKETGDINGRK